MDSYECKTLTPYTYEVIPITEAIELGTLFKRRFNTALSKVDLRGIAKPEEWERSKEVMMTIVEGLTIRFGQSIVSLANYNLRNALAHFRAVLENRRWFQRGVDAHPSFEITELDYALNNAAVLRALAMPTDDVYFDSEDIPIANILHNTVDAASDLLVSYILRYMLERMRSEDSTKMWAPFDLRNLVERATELFPEKVREETCWIKGIEWMESRGLIFRLDLQAHESMRFSLTPRSLELWRLLGENSVLLQCFREDVFRDMSSRWGMNKKSSGLKTDILFEDCLDLTMEIIEVERRHLKTAKTRGLLEVMRDTFGTQLLSLQVTQGLAATFDQYFPITPQHFVSKLNSVREGVKENTDYFE
jgi:hypothetical protein